jgi:hypothetical protein
MGLTVELGNKWVDGRLGVLNTSGGSNLLEVHWKDPSVRNCDISDGDVWLRWAEVFKNNESFTFSVPGFYNSLEDLKERKLKAEWGNGPLALERYSQLMLGLKMLGLVSVPGFSVSTIRKVYSDLPHGKPQKAFYRPVRNDSFYVSLKHANSASNLPSEFDSGRTTGGYSWRVLLRPETQEYQTQSLFMPMADLNVPYEENSERLSKLATTLALNGFSGSIIRSGESVHYLGDYLMPISLIPKTVSRLIHILTPAENIVAHNLAEELGGCRILDEAKVTGRRLLDEFPSGRSIDSDIDIRWVANIFVMNHGIASLRYLEAKSYRFKPYEVCRIG